MVENDAPRAPAYALTVAGRLKASDSENEGEQRVRAHLGSILRLNSLVVLMGAGASFHINGPEIRRSTIDSIQSLLADANLLMTDEEIEIIRAVCPDANFNLEALLERLNAAMAFAASTARDNVPIGPIESVEIANLKELRRKLNVGLVQACNLEKRSKTGNPWSVHQAFFRKLLSVRRDLPNTRIFTTNYDLAIEYALDESGIDYIDGFKGTVSRSFHPEVYNQLLYTATSFEQRRLIPVPSLLYIYKLHGSINWRTRGARADKRVVQVDPESKTTQDDLALIYPTQDKESSALGFPYADMIRAFHDSLLSPEVGFLTIGYGFADLHLNRILDRALASNYTMQMLMLDPTSIGTVEQDGEGQCSVTFLDTPIGRYASRDDARHASLLGKSATFENFTARIMPDLDIEDAADRQRNEWGTA